MNVSRPAKRATNNAAELESVIISVRQGEQEAILDDLLVLSDSEYTVNCVNRGIREWKSNDWTLRSGARAKNVDLLKELDHLRRLNKNWRLRYVPAHQDVFGNEMADYLANEGAKRFIVAHW
ncbi:uncharacterized protein LOC134846735 [Symsagittifera roscoffensis]|uniref:uncharacterized protein LOC134846735 n=1 Tax=Symsagittifera roscoffensis TaxID=84072 RepID=UPI00307C6CC1